jgi:hypothetical protein
VRNRQLVRYRFIAVRKFLDAIFSILGVFLLRWEIQTYVGLFFREVAYAKYDVPWSLE